MVPTTAVGPGAVTVKLAVVIEERSMASLNVALTLVLTNTPDAPAAGLTKLTVGSATSDVVPVVKVQTWLATRALPARSWTVVVIVAVYAVVDASGAVGANIAVRPASAYVTVPATLVAPCWRGKLVAPSVSG